MVQTADMIGEMDLFFAALLAISVQVLLVRIVSVTVAVILAVNGGF